MGAVKSLARPGRNKLQREKILIFIYPIYNHDWIIIIIIIIIIINIQQDYHQNKYSHHQTKYIKYIAK
jgi:hypothetical protein